MKKLNSKGSSPLLIVLILVIVGLIAGVGYYVYTSQKNSNTALDNAANSQADPQKAENKEEVADDKSTTEWQKYENTKYKFGYSYPGEAKITEREDALYFEASAIKDDGDNPAQNVWGNGNYKVQVQAYQYGQSLEEFLKTYNKKATINNISGLDRASVEVSSEEIQGPGYTEYYFGKGGVVLSLVIYGDFPYEINDLLNSVHIN